MHVSFTCCICFSGHSKENFRVTVGNHDNSVIDEYERQPSIEEIILHEYYSSRIFPPMCFRESNGFVCTIRAMALKSLDLRYDFQGQRMITMSLL